MEIPKRLENAITKLYTAFHNGKLKSSSCKYCAVGNICDNNSHWAYLRGWTYGKKVNSEKESLENWKGTVFYDKHLKKHSYQDALDLVYKTGYSQEEVIKIEHIFMKKTEESEKNKDVQFKGLCAVVEYLCELDNVPNVMDYSKLFEFNEQKEPIHELSF